MQTSKPLLGVMALPVEQRAGAAGHASSIQEPSVSLSCSRTNVSHPHPKKDKFSFQKLLFGMFNVFHQNHNTVFFSSHFHDVFNG